METHLNASVINLKILQVNYLRFCTTSVAQWVLSLDLRLRREFEPLCTKKWSSLLDGR